jgi:hypothetical protein
VKLDGIIGVPINYSDIANVYKVQNTGSPNTISLQYWDIYQIVSDKADFFWCDFEKFQQIVDYTWVVVYAYHTYHQ